jgi:hypothetical protein
MKPDLKVSALEEPSFAPIRDTPEFNKLMGPKLMNKYEEIEKLQDMIKGMKKK